MALSRRVWVEDEFPEDRQQVAFDDGLCKLTAAERDSLLEAAEHVVYRRGHLILTEGQPNDSIFVLAEGSVRIERRVAAAGPWNGSDDVTVEITRLGRGAIFGEMSFLEDAGASANVIANEGVGAFRIRREVIDDFAARDTTFAGRFYRSLAITLANRLRATNLRLGD